MFRMSIPYDYDGSWQKMTEKIYCHILLCVERFSGKEELKLFHAVYWPLYQFLLLLSLLLLMVVVMTLCCLWRSLYTYVMLHYHQSTLKFVCGT